MELKNLQILVTGGASGIGLKVAKMLIHKNQQVAILDQHEAVFNIAKEINGIGIHADVTNETSITEAFTVLNQHFDSLRVCINCAGIAPAKKILSKKGVMPLEDFKNVIDVNLIGTFNVMRKAAEMMSETSLINDDNERGVIINTASIAAFEGQIGQSAYAASKGGVVAMTLPAARELASHGIRVNTIAPGLVATPMLLNMPEDVQASLAKQVPFPKRLAKPEEYGMLAMQIIENTMINGEVIRLDGAMRMQAK